MLSLMVDHCERCGALAPGREQWMFHSGEARKEFYCFRCLRIFRVYAIIGLTLLGLILATAITAVCWLKMQR